MSPPTSPRRIFARNSSGNEACVASDDAKKNPCCFVLYWHSCPTFSSNVIFAMSDSTRSEAGNDRSGNTAAQTQPTSLIDMILRTPNTLRSRPRERES